MGGFTNYLETKILDYVFSGATYSPPSSVFVGLSTGSIAEDGTITGEPSSGGYQRVELTNNDTSFPAVSGGHKHNGVLISFATSSGDWGEINNFFIADAASGGNVLVYGALDSPRTININEQLIFSIDALTITLD